MNTKTASLIPMRFENHHTMHVAGLRLRLNENADREIPALWQRLAPHLGKIPTQLGSADYGLCIPVGSREGCFDYLAGIEVANSSSLPEDWTTIYLPAQEYAVFSHQGHVSKLRNTLHQIFDQWLPTSNRKHAQGGANPIHFFERYGEGFNPQTGFGDIEIWLPINT